MYNIYTTEETAIQTYTSQERGAVYSLKDSEGTIKYVWIPENSDIPYNSEPISDITLVQVHNFRILHTASVGANSDKTILLNVIMKYDNNTDNDISIWGSCRLKYTEGPINTAGINFTKYAEISIPDSAVIKGLLGEDDSDRADLSISEYIVDTTINFSELYDLRVSSETALNAFSIQDPNDKIAGLIARAEGKHIAIDIKVPDDAAFFKRYNRGYSCYRIKYWTFDGNINTTTTISGVAERTLVNTEEGMLNLNNLMNNKQTTFYIYPKFTDASILFITIEADAVFWKNDDTSLADMHTGVVEPDILYITKDPLSLSEKFPLENGFYNVSWDECMIVYIGDASPYLETNQKYVHVPGPSKLKVYNCIKTSDPVSQGNNNSYTLFKIQADKEQAISTPTSIIVPYYDVICTVGTAALESIENQTNTSSNDLWTSQN